MSVTSTGVGINQSNPQYQLDANGSVRLQTATVFQQYTGTGQTGFFVGNSLSTNQCAFLTWNSPYAPGATGSTGLGVFGVSQGLTVGPSGNVGVNQTNPLLPLDVTGAMRVFGNPAVGSAALYLQNASGGTGAPLIGFNTFTTPLRPTPSAIISGLDNTYSSDLAFSVAPGGTSTSFPVAVERMRITIGGNVGIGTPTPAYPLDVSGTARAANVILTSGGSNLQLGSANASQINFAYSLGGYVHSLKTRHNSGGAFNNSFDFYPWVPSDGANSSPNNLMMSVTGSGVGIGNNPTPAYPLDVNGAIKATMFKPANTNGYITSGPGGSSAYDYVQINGAGGTGVTVSFTSQVGINNTNPGYTLDVNGPARVSGQLYQSTPIVWFYKQTSISSTATGWQASSRSLFTFQSAGSKNVSDTLFASDAAPMGVGTCAVISLPFSGIWALTWTVRFANTATESNNSFSPMISASYGETNANSNYTRLGTASTSAYNTTASFQGYFASGDTLALTAYSNASNSLNTNSGFGAYLSVALVQRTA